MLKLLKAIFPFRVKRTVKEHLGVPSLHWSLLNLKKSNYLPKIVYDIGAYHGNWAKDFMEVFPDVTMFMFEAQQSKEQILKSFSESNSNIHFCIALLSSNDGNSVIFNENETASSVILKPPFTWADKKITISLDSIIKQNNYPLPDFLKLDVQGHELEVLKGGSIALNNAELCLLEVSLLDIGEGNPLLSDIVKFMNEQNFQSYDICQFMRRPFDKALYQIDMLFVKKESKLISSKRWN